MNILPNGIIAYIIDILYEDRYNISKLLFVSKQFYKYIDAKYIDSISNDLCGDHISAIIKYILSTVNASHLPMRQTVFRAINKNIHLKIICASRVYLWTDMMSIEKQILSISLHRMNIYCVLAKDKYMIHSYYNPSTDVVCAMKSFIKKYIPVVFDVLE